MIVIAAMTVVLIAGTLVVALLVSCVRHRNERPSWTRTYSRAEVESWKTPANR